METAPLKSFATWARTTLLGEVTARIAVVLAPGSSVRVERSNVVAALEKAVESAGGGELGRATVADRVAYTWFNRIIALRFMDANGYTGIGVVSPERGRDNGQPEILAEAKRGNIDSDVISNQQTLETVTGLLNGTRRSEDPQGEAFSLLLANYCQFWNRSMPFMFERESDFTELLMPANLLADDSVIARAVTALTEKVCQDVEVIGWLYQFYISDRKEEIFAGFKKNKKAGAAEIPAATQLFTPDWIVRYLVENSLGRLWLLNRPKSSIAEKMDYYIAPADEEIDFLNISSPEELKIIDPACGSGHMLTYAFELLYAIYDEEGADPADIPGLILTNNLYGTEIDPRAGVLAAFALTMKARARQRTFFTKNIQPNVCVLETIHFEDHELKELVSPGEDEEEQENFLNQFNRSEILGALIRPNEALIDITQNRISKLGTNLFLDQLKERTERVVKQAEYLSGRYHVVVANPPYMGSKNMGTELRDWLTINYPDVKSDLFSSFMIRNSELCIPKGMLGYMTPMVWMFISSHLKLRRVLLTEKFLASLIQLEYSGFEGATVPICTFTVKNAPEPGMMGNFVRLSDFKGAKQQSPRALEAIKNQDCGWFFRTQSSDLLNIPGAPIAYWATPATLHLFQNEPMLSDMGNTRQGMATGLNDEFVRQWFEVPISKIGLNMSRSEAANSSLRWFPYASGGEYRKWFGNYGEVVDWENDGERLQSEKNAEGRIRAHNFNLDYIFREGITWTSITSAKFSVRYLPRGFLFSSAANTLFSDRDLLPILGLLNSKAAGQIMKMLNPTLNANPGDVDRIPYAASELGIHDHVDQLVRIAEKDWSSRETSWDFSGSDLVATEYSNARISDIISGLSGYWVQLAQKTQQLEQSINELVIQRYGLTGQIDSNIQKSDITVSRLNAGKNSNWDNPDNALDMQAEMKNLISYALGCMFGRYSLDAPGLILANQADTLQDYLAKVPNPSFMPDSDNVIPIVDGDWFEDDIVTRFRQFLRAAFGDQHFEENLQFVTESLGVKDLRDYFVKSFYKDHVQRYKNRPIYWLFSSPKGSFRALIYIHRYTISTVSTVLNEYLREFKAKLEASRQHHERLAAGTGTAREKATAQKEVDRLRKVLLELDEYEHDVLYPLATQQIQIDLNDGVKANYPKFGTALKKIASLEAKDD